MLTYSHACPCKKTLRFIELPVSPYAGAAIRHCDGERGWLEPDLYNCTSPPFVELNAAVSRIMLVILPLNKDMVAFPMKLPKCLCSFLEFTLLQYLLMVPTTYTSPDKC